MKTVEIQALVVYEGCVCGRESFRGIKDDSDIKVFIDEITPQIALDLR